MLFLRGVGSGSASPSIDQAVSLVIDDMQVGSLQMQYSAMVDMDTVQVYKGPQALFFGKNSPGGVLSIRTADPGDEFEAQIKTGYEFEADEMFVQGILSGPLSDTAAGRLAVRYMETDGYFNVESGSFPSSLGGRAQEEESVFMRGTLLFTPTDDLTIRTKLTYSDREGPADGRAHIQRIYCPFGGIPQNSEPYECKANDTTQLVDRPQAAIDILAAEGIDIGPAGRLDNEQLLATVGLDYDINDEFSLSSVTGYYDISDFQEGSTLGLLQPVNAATQEIDFQQFTQELRLASEFSGPVNFLTGVYYEKKEHDAITTVPVDAGFLGGLGFVFWVLGGVTEYVQDTEAMSAFVDLTWDISDQLELSTGARYSYEEKEFEGISGYIGTVKEDWDDVSPQVTLTYTPNDDWMFFASYREGFKSGGFDGAFKFSPVVAVPFEPETVDGFEVGAKGTLLDNTLQLSAAVFSYEYEDLQLGRFDPETVSLSTVNAASAEITGFEADFVWLTPVDGLQARGAITYLDSEFKEFDAPCWTGQSPAAGCNQNLSPVSGAFTAQDLSGEPLTLAAEFVANLGLSYEQQVSSVARLGLSLDAVYSDDYETGSSQALETAQDSYTKLNASVTLSSLDDTWSISLIGRNLTDEFTITNGGNQPFVGGGTGTAAASPGDSIAYVLPGRTLAIELEYNF